MLSAYCLRFGITFVLIFFAVFSCASKVDDIRIQIDQEKQKYLPYKGLLLTLLDDNKEKISYIKEKLIQADLPENFYLIPLIESRYDNNALSHAGALGMWQIMPPTAVRFGLQVDDEIDQRRHFKPSTDAAIQYLRVLFKKFNRNESLTLAAYNAGEGRVGSAVRAPLAIAERFSSVKLPSETERYVYRYYALVSLLENNRLKEFSILQPITDKQSINFDSIFQSKKIINLEAIKPLIHISNK